jgi:hypothetical protein
MHFRNLYARAPNFGGTGHLAINWRLSRRRPGNAFSVAVDSRFREAFASHCGGEDEGKAALLAFGDRDVA